MYLENEANTPETYARQIAYISNPSTIRARVLEEYGRAPSIERIRKIQDERRGKSMEVRPSRYKNEEMDDFHVVGLVKRKRPKPQEVNRPLPPSVPSVKTPIDIIADVAWRMGLKAADVIGPSRERRFIHARRVIASIFVHRGMSRPDAASRIGRTDHSTIINLLRGLHKAFDAVPLTLPIYLEYVGQTQCKGVSCRCGEFSYTSPPASILSGDYPRVAVACCETGMLFPSIKDAGNWLFDKTGLTSPATSIMRSCDNGKPVGGFTWWRVSA